MCSSKACGACAAWRPSGLARRKDLAVSAALISKWTPPSSTSVTVSTVVLEKLVTAG